MICERQEEVASWRDKWPAFHCSAGEHRAIVSIRDETNGMVAHQLQFLDLNITNIVIIKYYYKYLYAMQYNCIQNNMLYHGISKQMYTIQIIYIKKPKDPIKM